MNITDQLVLKNYLYNIAYALWMELFDFKCGLSSALSYRLPKSTISDHMKDCFGFLCYKRRNRFDEFVDAFHEALVKEMPWLKGMGF